MIKGIDNSRKNIEESTTIKLPEGAADMDGRALGCELCLIDGNCDGGEEKNTMDGIEDGNMLGCVESGNDGASL